jgi:hypothetical protein
MDDLTVRQQWIDPKPGRRGFSILIERQYAITVFTAYYNLCSNPAMNDINRAARSRQRARLAEGEKPPAPRAALALAKSKTYQSAADAPETLRAYKSDYENFSAWCAAHGFQSMPAEPETVGA